MKFIDSFSESYPIYRIGMTIGTFLFYILIRKLFSKLISKRGYVHKFDSSRIIFIKNAILTTTTIVFLAILGILWEISLKGITVYIASFLTVVGVALFATWSVASNITVSIVLFFFFPFKIGSKIKIVDGDNSIEGTVLWLSLFSIKIKLEDGHDIYYPNNLAIQKGIILLE